MATASILTSPTGTTWTVRANPWDAHGGEGQTVATDGTLLSAGALIPGGLSSPVPVLQKSSDAVSWAGTASGFDTTRTGSAFGAPAVFSVRTDGAGAWTAIGTIFFDSGLSQVFLAAISPDATAWTEQDTWFAGTASDHWGIDVAFESSGGLWIGTFSRRAVAPDSNVTNFGITQPGDTTWFFPTDAGIGNTVGSVNNVHTFTLGGDIVVSGPSDFSLGGARSVISTDGGSTWATVSSELFACGLVGGSGRWIASSPNGIYTSDNSGSTWTNRDSFQADGITTDGSTLTAVGSFAHNSALVATSADNGTTWSTHTTPIDDSTAFLNDVTWVSGLSLFVAVGFGPFTAPAGGWLLGGASSSSTFPTSWHVGTSP